MHIPNGGDGILEIDLRTRLADHVKPKPLDNIVDMNFDFVFGFIPLDRFIAQCAVLTDAVTGNA
jgi:hypothetical protein